MSAPLGSVTATSLRTRAPSPGATCPGHACFVSVPFSAITRRDRILSSGLAWHTATPRGIWLAMEGFREMTTIQQRAVQPADGGLQQLLAGLSAVRSGDFSTRLPADGDPLMDEIASVFNGMNDQLALFTSEVTRVAREVGTEGRLGGQAEVPGLAGTWKDLTDSVNSMAGNLTGQVRDVARVATAVARGDLSQTDLGRRQGRDGRAQGHPQHDGGRAVGVRRRGDPGGPGGGHRGPAGRPGAGARRRRHLARPDRLGELDGRQPDRPGAQHRPGDHRGGQGRPQPEDHRRRARRDPGTEEHRQHDGGRAVGVRRRGDPGGPRGGHRGPARRPGAGARVWAAPGAT